MAIVQHFIHNMNVTKFFYTLSSSLMVAALVSCSATLTPAEIRRVQRFERYLQAAKAGDTEAQMYVAKSYRRGHNVAQNLQEAEMWYRRLAGQGNISAQLELIRMYDSNGEFANENPSECVRLATQLYENPKASYEAKESAAFTLTLCHSKGYGVEKSPEKALEWKAKGKDAYLKYLKYEKKN